MRNDIPAKLRTATGSVIHLESLDPNAETLCDTVSASRGQRRYYVADHRAEVTCKRCLASLAKLLPAAHAAALAMDAEVDQAATAASAALLAVATPLAMLEELAHDEYVEREVTALRALDHAARFAAAQASLATWPAYALQLLDDRPHWSGESSEQRVLHAASLTLPAPAGWPVSYYAAAALPSTLAARLRDASTFGDPDVIPAGMNPLAVLAAYGFRRGGEHSSWDLALLGAKRQWMHEQRAQVLVTLPHANALGGVTGGRVQALVRRMSGWTLVGDVRDINRLEELARIAVGGVALTRWSMP